MAARIDGTEQLVATISAKVARASSEIQKELRDIGDDAQAQAHKYLDALIYDAVRPGFSDYVLTTKLRQSTRVDDSGLSDFRVAVRTGGGFAPYAQYIERGPGGKFGAPKKFRNAGILAFLWPTYQDFLEGRGRQSVQDRIRQAVERA